MRYFKEVEADVEIELEEILEEFAYDQETFNEFMIEIYEYAENKAFNIELNLEENYLLDPKNLYEGHIAEKFLSKLKSKGYDWLAELIENHD